MSTTSASGRKRTNMMVANKYKFLQTMTTISLLINTAADDDQEANGICFGGKPSAPEGALEWPTCASCDGHMQFLGQIPVETQQGKTSLLLLFMCQNDPGLCDEWDADAGGNAVIVVPAKSIGSVAPPEEGETIRPVRYSAAVVEIEGGSYDEARENWAASAGVNFRNVLGQIGGVPAWLQGEEVPFCDSCKAPMSFVAQLEEGPDHETSMNFGGGGCAYVYHCRCDKDNAKMLWQS